MTISKNIKLRPHQERAFHALQEHSKGTIIFPTGGGKTNVAVMDTVREFQSKTPQTIVVVAPRILLATQLSFDFMEFVDNAKVFHCHSGDVHWESSTHLGEILQWILSNEDHHKLIFTTYHSLCLLQSIDLDVDTIYFDEAHNSVRGDFFPATEHFSANARRSYFFTATRRTSNVISKPGMNDVEIYGNIIARASAPELVNNNIILPPKIETKKFNFLKKDQITAECDRDNILNTIDDIHVDKILICAKSTKQIITLMSESDFAQQLHDRGYSYLYITSKTGAVVDGMKVNREKFFETLNSWGKEHSKKFVVLHRSILSEGINVSELESVIFLRNMSIVEMTQTVGRVLRKGEDHKKYGLCVVPVYSNTGIATEKSLQNIVDTVFEKGEILDSEIQK